MGINITEYKVSYTIKTGRQFRLAFSYGFHHENGVIQIDYLGLINQDILDSPTDVETWLDGQDSPGDVIWVGYRYLSFDDGSSIDDYMKETMYCPVFAIESNIRGM